MYYLIFQRLSGLQKLKVFTKCKKTLYYIKVHIFFVNLKALKAYYSNPIKAYLKLHYVYMEYNYNQ